MAGVALVASGACQTAPADGPARLQPGDSASLTALQAALGAALGRPQIALGAGDPALSGAVSVLPERPGQYETRSPAMPVMFDLAFRAGACVAVRRDSGALVALPGVACAPISVRP